MERVMLAMRAGYVRTGCLSTGEKDVFAAGHAHQAIGGIRLDRPPEPEHKTPSLFVFRALVVARSRTMVDSGFP